MAPMVLRIDDLYLATKGYKTEKAIATNHGSLSLPCRGHRGRSSHMEHITVASFCYVGTQNFSVRVAVLLIKP